MCLKVKAFLIVYLSRVGENSIYIVVNLITTSFYSELTKRRI